jgi:hypothetical protein
VALRVAKRIVDLIGQTTPLLRLVRWNAPAAPGSEAASTTSTAGQRKTSRRVASE